MATIVDLNVNDVKTALMVAYQQATRAEKTAEIKYGAESPITKELERVRIKLNQAIMGAKEHK